MKTFIILVFLSCSFLSAIAQQESHWHLDFEVVKQIAREENKTILMSFAGSDWCKPCIKLTREVFETKEFQSYAQENLVLLLLDFPRLKKNAIPKDQVLHNEKLAEKYNRDGAFPLIVLTNQEGEEIGHTGYRTGGAEPFIKYLNTILEK